MCEAERMILVERINRLQVENYELLELSNKLKAENALLRNACMEAHFMLIGSWRQALNVMKEAVQNTEVKP